MQLLAVLKWLTFTLHRSFYIGKVWWHLWRFSDNWKWFIDSNKDWFVDITVCNQYVDWDVNQYFYSDVVSDAVQYVDTDMTHYVDR